MNKITEKQIEEFLRKVDYDFPVPLSQKQDLSELAKKFFEKATICAEVYDGIIVSMVAGYTENIINNSAYISVVATLEKSRGKGLISKLIKEFTLICMKKGISSIHLYAVPSNTIAIRTYYNLGFEKLELEKEPRPEDIHLIYYIKK